MPTLTPKAISLFLITECKQAIPYVIGNANF